MNSSRNDLLVYALSPAPATPELLLDEVIRAFCGDDRGFAIEDALSFPGMAGLVCPGGAGSLISSRDDSDEAMETRNAREARRSLCETAIIEGGWRRYEGDRERGENFEECFLVIQFLAYVLSERCFISEWAGCVSRAPLNE